MSKTMREMYEEIRQEEYEAQVNEIVKIVDNYFSHQIVDAVSVTEKVSSDNNGGSTDYYKLPNGATELHDLIEAKEMNFAIGNIFKACYRMGNVSHSDAIRDLNKIVWFAQRELERLK